MNNHIITKMLYHLLCLESELFLKITTASPVDTLDPCKPSPCATNAICRVVGGRPICSCLPGHFGDPIHICRPECITNSECRLSQACIGHKCVDPCRGVCGEHASCRVVLHAPVCTCSEEYTGDPYSKCQLLPCKIVKMYSWFTVLGSHSIV